MDDIDKKLCARLTKLVEVERELLAQLFDIVEEKRKLLMGEPGIADKVKQLETQFDALWSARYTPGEVGCYVWSFQKDRANMKRLAKILSVEEIESRMEIYMRREELFYTNARHSFALFVASINSHTQDMSRVRYR